MVTSAIVCPECRRVIAVGAGLPAVCFGAIPPEERVTQPPQALDADPRAHRDCVELEVTVTDGLRADERLAEVERTYADQLAALAGLVRQFQPDR